MILNGVENMVHRDFEQSEVGSLSVGLGRVPWRLFADCARSSVPSLLWEGRLRLRLLPLDEGSTAPGRILDLDVLLSAGEDVSHFGDFVLHQVLVGVCDLQLTDERRSNHVVVAVIHQDHRLWK